MIVSYFPFKYQNRIERFVKTYTINIKSVLVHKENQPLTIVNSVTNITIIIFNIQNNISIKIIINTLNVLRT